MGFLGGFSFFLGRRLVALAFCCMFAEKTKKSMDQEQFEHERAFAGEKNLRGVGATWYAAGAGVVGFPGRRGYTCSVGRPGGRCRWAVVRTR